MEYTSKGAQLLKSVIDRQIANGGEIVVEQVEKGPMQVQRLQNGYVRVDTKCGLVHLWEMVPGLAGPMIQRRHGDGISELGEVEAVWSAFDLRGDLRRWSSNVR